MHVYTLPDQKLILIYKLLISHQKEIKIQLMHSTHIICMPHTCAYTHYYLSEMSDCIQPNEFRHGLS